MAVISLGSRRFSGAAVFSVYCVLFAFLGYTLLWPLYHIVLASLHTMDGAFAGFGNFLLYFQTPNLWTSFVNTLFIGSVVSCLTVTAAFLCAYGVTHVFVKGRRFCQLSYMFPLFLPSLFPALGLIYLLGEQGMVRQILCGSQLYGPTGIILGCFIYTFPHAFVLMVTTLKGIDQNQYFAAMSLGAGPWKRLRTITLPNSWQGILQAMMVVFIISTTDFGIPKVLGGNFPMLSIEIYKQVIGLHNISMGATASLALLFPAAVAFIFSNWAYKKNRALSGSAGGNAPLPLDKGQIWLCSAVCWAIAILFVGATGIVIVASFFSFWPYDLSFTLEYYFFSDTMYGFTPYWNSIILAVSTGFLGAILVFSGAYIILRCQLPGVLGKAYSVFASLPLCLPGTLLGVSYILAFNSPSSFLYPFYGTLFFLILNSIVHLYGFGHLAAFSALDTLKADYETIGKTLGVSRLATMRRVIFPLQKKFFLSVVFYLFVNAITSVTALVFISSPDSIPAAVAILQMLETGQLPEASAMGTLLLFTVLLAKGAHSLGERYL